MEQCCGTCKYHRTDDNGEWVCTNDLSEYYALETDYSDGCVDWTGRDETENFNEKDGILIIRYSAKRPIYERGYEK